MYYWPPSCAFLARDQGFVPRPRLAERLYECVGPGLVLACAPACPGETVLLADWARVRPTVPGPPNRARQGG